jgi:nitrite reductase/ring-hydroxylating ferredoxin subunit
VPEPLRIEHPTLPEEGHAVRLVAGDIPIALFRSGGALYALDARCTHVGGPLDRGTLSGTQVTCPLHHSVFDIRDGKVLRGPAARPATAFRVRQEGTTLVLERE